MPVETAEAAELTVCCRLGVLGLATGGRWRGGQDIFAPVGTVVPVVLSFVSPTRIRTL